MGAQKSIHAGKAKIDVNVDFTHKLCAALMLPPSRSSGDPFSFVVGSLCIKHPSLFGRSEKLDVSWEKGLCDSNVLIAYRRPRPEWLAQQSLVFQHSISPEIGVHGLPIDNFSRTGSGGVNLSKFSVGLDLDERASSNWSSTTSVKFEHIRPISDNGHSISRDLDGFPVTCSLTGGSVVGDMAPYQAFAIGGLGSVRGYGDGAVGSGTSCLIANSELTLPLNKMLDGAVFLDCGTDLGSGRHVPGNPALRQGKPGSGLGLGYGFRVKSQFGHCQIDFAINAFQQKTVYFGISNIAS
ncbi:outer envelope protein 39, chloroplastic isoform X3 [Malania oleifera]|uniref:outer envelope protein 39, chloroplastic isoform X3 n=1 Tax=Malania oleifera TaxID=397392 RepID=UPI0025ADAFB5|nr:outer envelope protein 39, chloroplastic isoform X3 [Malania oleifera]